MQLLIKNKPLAYWNDLEVTLVYNSVASSFSFTYLFSPWNATHRELFLPGTFYDAQVKEGSNLLISGNLLVSNSSRASVKGLRTLSGYSRTGVLQECTATEGLQFDGMSLKEIAEGLCKPFNLKVVVDDVVKGECEKVYNSATIEPDGKIRDFLSKLACQRNVVISHNSKGEMVLTRANTHKEPIGHFEDGDRKGLKISLDFNGQAMHSEIVVKAQGVGDNIGESSIKNPYVYAPGAKRAGEFDPNYRPAVEVQSAGDDNDTPLTARYYLGQELRNIGIKVEQLGWHLNGKLPLPGEMITLRSPENSIYQKTRLFVDRVRFFLDQESFAEMSELNCVVPEVYNDEEVVNIFRGSNLTVPGPVSGAHAVITPYDQQ